MSKLKLIVAGLGLLIIVGVLGNKILIYFASPGFKDSSKSIGKGYFYNNYSGHFITHSFNKKEEGEIIIVDREILAFSYSNDHIVGVKEIQRSQDPEAASKCVMWIVDKNDDSINEYFSRKEFIQNIKIVGFDPDRLFNNKYPSNAIADKLCN